MGLILPAVTSGMAASSLAQSNSKALSREKADKRLLLKQLQQKDAQSASDKAEIEQLKKDVQTKKDNEAKVATAPAPVSSGRGGNFVGPMQFANSYDFGQCTYFVASVLHVPNNWGNANTWDDYARGMGYGVDENPMVGSIAQTDAGYWGHVAVVVAVNDGQVEVREMNVVGWNVIDEAWYGLFTFKYIHV